MRYVLWLLLIFAVAVVAAVTLGRNDGAVTIAWQGWRMDMSLNLFLAGLLLTCVALVMALQALDSLISLPKRARDWRVQSRDRAAQSALREALAEHFAARYRRAQKAAQRSAAILDDTPELDTDGHARMLAHVRCAASAHKLQDRASRAHHLAHLNNLHRTRGLPRSQRGHATSVAADEGAKLLAIEWALDDRDAQQALALLDALPAGAARRTQALRLRLQAQQQERQPLQALQTARLLAKHQGFRPNAARGLVRSLAIDALQATRDVDQLKTVWQKLDATERLDPFVAAEAAVLATQTGDGWDDPTTARGWLEPLWRKLATLPEDERAALATALTQAVRGADAAWLARVEEAALAQPQDAAIAAAAGAVYAERQLWGKARPALEQAAKAQALPAHHRRAAWRSLAALARAQDDEPRAHDCDHEAARLV
jgi:HemY protein